MKAPFQIFIFVLLSSPFILSAQCTIPTAHTFLNANGISAGLTQGGSLWWNGDDAEYYFPIPALFPTATLFAGGIWMGGLDPSGNYKIAASTYGASSGESDYGAGPLTETGETDSMTCSNWDRFFEVGHAEILEHIADYEDNGQIDNTPPASILGWPGQQNPSFMDVHGFELPFAPQGLAPFYDVNTDGIYSPMLGDYPLTKEATEAIWWVFNDASSVHTSTQGDQLKMEIQMMAFAYADDNEDINNTTYYQAKMIYRGAETISDMHFALWVDPDLGCYTDDYVGCSPEANMAFVYNADELDGDPGCSCDGGVSTFCGDIPITAIKIIEAPRGDMNEDTEMSSFVAYTNSSTGGPANELDPSTPLEYHRLMQGNWRDGSPMVDPDGNETKFHSPGNPSSTTEWSMCNPQIAPDDRRMLMGFGPYNLLPGSIKQLTFAVVTVPSVQHPCPNIEPIIQAGEVASDFFNGIVNNSEPIVDPNLVRIAPNPFNNTAQLSIAGSETLSQISIFSLDGKLVQEINGLSGQTATIKKGALNAGMYFYKLLTQSEKVYTGKFIIE